MALEDACSASRRGKTKNAKMCDLLLLIYFAFLVVVEVSDQNFVDQDVKGGKESTCSPKRMKTLMVDASGSDQVASPNQHPFTGLPEVIALPL
uniref:Uncharacterized protein LOC105129510 isoform X4 n=1 Tax=Rhizophora mucronata TaxID=61149 RepID=A0A2P2K4M4_RHIMU